MMKTIYSTPQIEVIPVNNATMLMQQISGPEGLKDGGKATGGIVPRAPQKPF